MFTISTTTILARLKLAPDWLILIGFSTGALLLILTGTVPWIELIFPAWVFVLSAYILVVRTPHPAAEPDHPPLLP